MHEVRNSGLYTFSSTAAVTGGGPAFPPPPLSRTLSNFSNLGHRVLQRRQKVFMLKVSFTYFLASLGALLDEVVMGRNVHIGVKFNPAGMRSWVWVGGRA